MNTANFRHAESAYRSTRSYYDYAVYKTLRNRYHKLVVAAKKAYYFFLVADSASNPQRQWDIINRILHCNSSIVLPSSVSLSSLASQFAAFFKEKISQLRLTLSANHVQSAHYPSPLASPPDFSVFLPATEDEIIKPVIVIALISSVVWMPYQLHCSSIAVISWPQLSLALSILVFLRTGQFCPKLKQSIITPLLKKPSLDKENVSN